MLSFARNFTLKKANELIIMKAIQVQTTGGPDVLKFTDVEAPKPGAGTLSIPEERVIEITSRRNSREKLRYRGQLYRHVSPNRPLPDAFAIYSRPVRSEIARTVKINFLMLQ